MPELQSLLAKHYRLPLSLLQLGLTEKAPSKVIYFGFTSQQKPPLLVIRESRSREYSQRIQKEYEARSSLYPYLPPRLRQAVPWVELLEGPNSILVEPYLSGQELPYPQDHKAFFRYIEQVTTWIQAFQTAIGPRPGDLVGQAHGLLDHLQDRLPRHRLWLSSLRPHLTSLRQLSPCPVHGDFWRGNLLVQRGELRVIDWEYIQQGGNPWFDVLLNLVSLACEGGDAQGIFEQCFLRDSSYSRSIGSRLNGPHEAIALSVVLVVLELISRDLANGSNIDKTAHYALLRRLMYERDPLGAIQKVLWTNQPDLLAKVT